MIRPNRVEPFFSWIRPGPHTSAFEYVLLPVTLGLIAVGVVIAVRPLFERGFAVMAFNIGHVAPGSDNQWPDDGCRCCGW